MDNDSIRVSGSNTLVEIWVDGKLRALSISREAIGAFFGFDQAAGMSDDERCDFVRSNLSLIVSAAKAKLRETDPTAGALSIEADDLPRPDGLTGERRKNDRRAKDRRKADKPKGTLPHTDRRRSDRRTGERRRSAKPAKEPG